MELFKPVALITQIAVLAITGVAFLIWMGVNDWQDTPGSTMGGIFIVLALLQAAFSFLWWRQAKKEERNQSTSQPDRYDVKMASVAESRA